MDPVTLRFKHSLARTLCLKHSLALSYYAPGPNLSCPIVRAMLNCRVKPRAYHLFALSHWCTLGKGRLYRIVSPALICAVVACHAHQFTSLHCTLSTNLPYHSMPQAPKSCGTPCLLN